MLLKKAAERYFSPVSSIYHYLHMAKGNYREYLQGEYVKVKKYFYVLRPILAAKWILNKKSIPPIEFLKLLKEERDTGVKLEIEKILEKKLKSSELQKEKRIEILDNYIENNLTFLEIEANKIQDEKIEILDLDDYFYSLINGL